MMRMIDNKSLVKEDHISNMQLPDRQPSEYAKNSSFPNSLLMSKVKALNDGLVENNF